MVKGIYVQQDCYPWIFNSVHQTGLDQSFLLEEFCTLLGTIIQLNILVIQNNHSIKTVSDTSMDIASICRCQDVPLEQEG